MRTRPMPSQTLLVHACIASSNDPHVLGSVVLARVCGLRAMYGGFVQRAGFPFFVGTYSYFHTTHVRKDFKDSGMLSGCTVSAYGRVSIGVATVITESRLPASYA